jgi:hypothetical protein
MTATSGNRTVGIWGSSLVAVVACGLVFVPPARAQESDEEQARRLFDEGVAAASQGNYTTAIFAFERSYDLYPHAATLKNLALYQDQAGRLADAFRSWSELLARYGDAVSEATREEARARIAELDALLARVTLSVNVDGAAVFVDGRELGTAPIVDPIRVEPGQHVFEARMDGYDDGRVSRLVGEGAQAEVQLVLIPRAPTPAVLRIESGTAGALAAVDGGPPEPLPIERNVEPGVHEVRLAAPGFLGETRRVSVGEAERVVVAVDLTPIVTEAGVEDGGFWSGPWPWIIGGTVLAIGGGVTAAVLLWPEEGPSSKWTLRVR